MTMMISPLMSQNIIRHHVDKSAFKRLRILEQNISSFSGLHSFQKISSTHPSKCFVFWVNLFFFTVLLLFTMNIFRNIYHLAWFFCSPLLAFPFVLFAYWKLFHFFRSSSYVCFVLTLAQHNGIIGRKKFSSRLVFRGRWFSISFVKARDSCRPVQTCNFSYLSTETAMLDKCNMHMK